MMIGFSIVVFSMTTGFSTTVFSMMIGFSTIVFSMMAGCTFLSSMMMRLGGLFTVMSPQPAKPNSAAMETIAALRIKEISSECAIDLVIRHEPSYLDEHLFAL